MHVRIQRGTGGPDPPPPENIGFSSNTGPDPPKNHCYQASIQCWAIIGTPAKCQLMAFRLQADDCPLIVVLGSSLSLSTYKKKKKKKCQSLTPSGKTFWIRACNACSSLGQWFRKRCHLKKKFTHYEHKTVDGQRTITIAHLGSGDQKNMLMVRNAEQVNKSLICVLYSYLLLTYFDWAHHLHH